MTDRAGEEVLEAAAVLLSEVHDIDFHYSSCCGPVDWLHREQLEWAAAVVLQVAERLAASARTATDAIGGAVARRDWLQGGQPLWCLACGDPIDPATDTWRVCRGHAEHTACHRDDPAAEDADRAFTLGDAEHDAYLQDRTRTGVRTGDVVTVTYPDGTSQDAVWRTGPDGTGSARTDDYHARPVDLATATGVEIIELVEDIATAPADGTPVDPDVLATLVVAVCGACDQPLTDPAVWARGYPLHPSCLPASAEPTAAGESR